MALYLKDVFPGQVAFEFVSDTGLKNAAAGPADFLENIAAWADISGNGVDVAQPTDALRPQKALSTNGMPAVRVDGTKRLFNASFNDWTGKPQYCVVLLFRPLGGGNQHFVLDYSDLNTLLYSNYINSFSRRHSFGISGLGTGKSTQPNLGLNFIVISANGVSSPRATFHQNRVDRSILLPTNDGSTTTLSTGLRLFNPSVISEGTNADVFAVACLKFQPTAAQVRLIEQTYRRFTDPESYYVKIITEGDSLTYGLQDQPGGASGTYATSYPAQLGALFGNANVYNPNDFAVIGTYDPAKPLIISNQGVIGDHLVGQITPQGSLIDLNRNEWRREVEVLMCGTNDLGDGTAASTLLSAMQSYIAARTDARLPVIVCTVPARDDTEQGWTPTLQAQMDLYNAGIRANWQAWGAVRMADVNAVLHNPHDFTLYQTEKLHLTPAGNLVLAQVVYAQLNDYLMEWVTPSPLATAYTNAAYTKDIVFSGGSLPMAVTYDTLPAGFTITQTGDRTATISNPGPALGDYQFNVTATDAAGQFINQSFTLSVKTEPIKTMITIVGKPILNIQESTEGWTVRAYLGENFAAADGGLVLADATDNKGSYFAAPFVSGIADIPSIDLAATTNSLDNPIATYSILGLYDKKGRLKYTLLTDFFLPASLYPATTLENVEIANRSPFLARAQSFNNRSYTDAQIDAKDNQISTVAAGIAEEAILSALPNASVSVEGLAKLTDPPTAPTAPIAVSATAPSYVSALRTRYLDEFGGSLATAVSTIGAAPATLEVSASITAPDSNLTIPATLRLAFTGRGSVSVPATRTLTINSMDNPGNRQVFLGLGNVVLGKNAVDELNLYWWTGANDTQDATKALNNLCASLASGGNAILPAGTWQTSAGLIRPINSSLKGSGTGATVIKAAANNIALDTITGNVAGYGLKLQNTVNLAFDGDNRTGVKGAVLTGAYPYSIYHLGYENILFKNLSIGCLLNATDATWQVEFLNFRRCIFQNCPIGYQANSPNGSVTFEEPYFFQGVGQKALNLIACGSVRLQSPKCYGVAGMGAPSDGSTFIYIDGTNVQILVDDYQDEAIEYFLNTGTNNYLPGRITVEGSLIQSKVFFNSNRTFISRNNQFCNAAFKNAAGVAAVVYSHGDYAALVNLDNTANTNSDFNGFTGNTSRFAERADLTSLTTQQGQFLEVRPGVSLAAATQTVTPAFPTTAKPSLTVIGENIQRPFVQWGDISSGNFYGHQWYRGSDGALHLVGNQANFRDLTLDQGNFNVTNGYVLTPTPAPGTNSTVVATTAFVQDAVNTERVMRINAQTGTTYTVSAADLGKKIVITNAAAITLTVPVSLGAGFNFAVEQGGAGQITFVGGATLHNVDGHTKTKGQYAIVSFQANAANIFTFQGATA